MNPHTPNPDEGRDAAGRTPGQSAAQPADPAAARPDDLPPADTPPGRPDGSAPDAAATAPVDTSATLPLDFQGASATLPLNFPPDATGQSGPGSPAGPAGTAHPSAGPPPPYYGSTAYGQAPPYSGQSPYPGGPTPPAATGPQNYFDWIRSQGIQRGRERWVGGVASGLAQRFGVDPLIVRGILIVLTIFAGVGVLLYGIAWAFLPEPDGRIHVQEAAAGRWSSGMTGALITTIVGFPSLGSGVWGWDRYGVGPFIWTVLWVGAVIYLVYYLTQRNKSRIGATPMSSTPPAMGPSGPAYPPGPAAASSASSPTNASSPAASAGAAPFAKTAYGASDTLPRFGESTVPGPAWGTPPSGSLPPGGGYRPEPAGALPPAKARNLGPGAPAVAVTAGLALLVGGGLKALDVANVIDLGTAGTAVVWASAAVVLGLGILVAGLRGRTSGILGFFAVAALITSGIYSALPNGDRFRPQNVDWTPVSIEQARNGFDVTAGNGTVDLTRIALDPPLRTDLVVPIDATASNLTVVIPRSVPVQVRADMTMGNLNEGSRSRGGVSEQQSNYNTDEPGAPLIVEIDGTFSNVTIREGN